MTSDNRTRTVLALDSARTHRSCAGKSRSGRVASVATPLALLPSNAFADLSPTASVGAGLRTSDEPTEGIQPNIVH